jgi:hypothetical protein
MDLQLPVQSVPITTDVVSLNLDQCEVYNNEHYGIKFVSDLQHVNVMILLYKSQLNENESLVSLT